MNTDKIPAETEHYFVKLSDHFNRLIDRMNAQVSVVALNVADVVNIYCHALVSPLEQYTVHDNPILFNKNKKTSPDYGDAETLPAK